MFDGLSQEQFAATLSDILEARDRGTWGIGDAALYVDAHPAYEAAFYQVVTPDRISQQGVANAKSLARRFPPVMRRWKLSASHYEAVRTLTDEQVADILDEAQTSMLDREAVRDIVRGIKQVRKVEAQVVTGTIADGGLTLYLDSAVKLPNGARVKVSVVEIVEVQ